MILNIYIFFWISKWLCDYYLQGDQGLSGEPGLPGERGVGEPGPKVSPLCTAALLLLLLPVFRVILRKTDHKSTPFVFSVPLTQVYKHLAMQPVFTNIWKNGVFLKSSATIAAIPSRYSSINFKWYYCKVRAIFYELEDAFYFIWTPILLPAFMLTQANCLLAIAS